jgi:hypothetical protein
MLKLFEIEVLKRIVIIAPLWIIDFRFWTGRKGEERLF